MQVKHLTFSMRLTLAIALLCHSIASYYAERIYNGDWANWNHTFGAMGLFWYLRLFYKARRDVILTGFFQIYSSLGMLLSAAFVSGGMYMFEVAEFGNQNGIFWVLVLYFVAGLEANGLGFRAADYFHVGKPVQKPSKITGRLLILCITLATLVISAYVFINYRGPIILGIDRVAFWRNLVPSYLSFVPTLVTQSFFFVAYYYLWAQRSGQKSRLPMMIVVAYVLTGLFVLGQKLSLFMLFITVWFSLLPGTFPNFTIKRTHLIALLSAVAFLVASVLYSYSLQDKETGFALARIALQAQVMWSVFDDANASIFWPSDWSCYFGCGQFTDGIDLISFKYLPFDLYKFYAAGGTTLSGFMPALSIITMGLAASFLLHLAVSFTLGIVQRKLVLATFEDNIIYSFLLYKAHISLTLIWFAAMTTAVPGLIAVLLLIGLYRFCFPVFTVKSSRELYATF